jgi:hypothetical protein
MQSARMDNKRKKMSQSLRWKMLGEGKQLPWETPKRIDTKRKELKWHSLCNAIQYNTIQSAREKQVMDHQFEVHRDYPKQHVLLPLLIFMGRKP